MAKARPIRGLSSDESYAGAAAKVVTARGEELAELAAGVLDTSDIERVHDMRVATRRLRAALEVFAPCFPPKAHRRTLREVKRMADRLGERRDRDVAIAALESFSHKMHAPDRPGVESLIAKLRVEQARANDELAPLVSAEHLAAVRESIVELVAAARGASP